MLLWDTNNVRGEAEIVVNVIVSCQPPPEGIIVLNVYYVLHLSNSPKHYQNINRQ